MIARQERVVFLDARLQVVEEALPAETVLYGFAQAIPVKSINVTPQKVFEELKNLTNKVVQLGGKATVGRGVCRVQLISGGMQA